jgi:hypothetical protein
MSKHAVVVDRLVVEIIPLINKATLDQGLNLRHTAIVCRLVANALQQRADDLVAEAEVYDE